LESDGSFTTMDCESEDAASSTARLMEESLPAPGDLSGVSHSFVDLLPTRERRDDRDRRRLRGFGEGWIGSGS